MSIVKDHLRLVPIARFYDIDETSPARALRLTKPIALKPEEKMCEDVAERGSLAGNVR